ncbi:putative Mn2+ efflux pump MntP [Neisseria sp. HSC-16F19]|nr:hypothetical protein [Neisseria sp. HSC-16F19]MCP2041122.1 putative Mn2+ efflux pump MntP [Neisseria sp. HSC-16F19]
MNEKYKEILQREFRIKAVIVTVLGVFPAASSLIGWLLDNTVYFSRVLTFIIGMLVILLLLPSTLKAFWELKRLDMKGGAE